MRRKWSVVSGQLLVVVAVLLLVPAIASAQAAPSAAAQVTVAPAMKLEDQLRVRELQYAQDKALLEMQHIEARYKELQASVRALDSQIADTVRAAGVDPNKFVFDLDTLKFVARPSPAVNQPAKPLEVKPK